MIRLLLARHGETAWNEAHRYQGWSDPALNSRGQRQAEQLARRLQGEAIDACYASDLQRAWETAAVAGRALQIAPQAEPRLREIGFGVVEGLTFSEAEARYPQMMAAWLENDSLLPHGAETTAAFAGRLAALLVELKRRHAEQTLLLVAHGGSIRELLRQALGLPPAGRWLFTVELGSLSEVRLYEERGLLSRLNDCCHLHEEEK